MEEDEAIDIDQVLPYSEALLEEDNVTTTSSSQSLVSTASRPTKTSYIDSQVDWQMSKSKLADRGRHLLVTGVWSDCQFTVGVSPGIKVH